jgi:hypothetical protein
LCGGQKESAPTVDPGQDDAGDCDLPRQQPALNANAINGSNAQRLRCLWLKLNKHVLIWLLFHNWIKPFNPYYPARSDRRRSHRMRCVAALLPRRVRIIATRLTTRIATRITTRRRFFSLQSDSVARYEQQ